MDISIAKGFLLYDGEKCQLTKDKVCGYCITIYVLVHELLRAKNPGK